MQSLDTITRGDYRARFEYDDCASIEVAIPDRPFATLWSTSRYFNSIDDKSGVLQQMESAYWDGDALDVLKAAIEEGAVDIRVLTVHHHSATSIHIRSENLIPLTDAERVEIFRQPRGWDTSLAGFAVVMPQTVEYFGTPADRIGDALEGEIKSIQQYLDGEVHGYIIEKRDSCNNPNHDDMWEEVESCWGYLGDDWVIEAATEILDSLSPLKAEVNDERQN